MTVIRLPAAQQELQADEGRPDAAFPAAPTVGDDAQLVQAAAEGSIAAWSSLVARHSPAVWAWAVDYAVDGAVAAQISEVVWLRLAQSLGTLGGEPVASWLCRQVQAEGRRERSAQAERRAPAVRG